MSNDRADKTTTDCTTAGRAMTIPILSSLLVLLMYAAGCNSELGQQFRRAAGPQLESGITQVLNGIVDGAFEVYQPDNDSTDTTTG